MNLKLFYSPPWKAFEAPEKPSDEKYWFKTPWAYEEAIKNYEKAYAEAKANALEVGNWELIIRRLDENFPNGVILIEGEVYDWKGSAVIKDGKYILSI